MAIKQKSCTTQTLQLLIFRPMTRAYSSTVFSKCKYNFLSCPFFFSFFAPARQIISAAQTLALHPSSKIAKENLEVFCEAWESQLCDMAMLLREINDVFEGRRGASQVQAPAKPRAFRWDASAEGTGEFSGQVWSRYPHSSWCFKATGTKSCVQTLSKEKAF